MKKALEPCQRKELAGQIIEEEDISISRTCKIVNLSRSMFYYQSIKDDSEITDYLNLLAEQYPTRGFDTYYGKIRLAGLGRNRKRVLRIYRSNEPKDDKKAKKKTSHKNKNTIIHP